MKYINLSSLVRNANENSDIFSLAAKKAIAVDIAIVNTSGNIDNFSTSEESSFKFTAADQITGFSGGTDGKIITIHNANPNSLIIANDSTSSSSENRIYTGSGSDLTLLANSSILLQYDIDSTIWRIIGGSGGGGGNSTGLTYQITATPPVTLKVGMPVYWNGTNYAPSNANTNTKIPTAIVKEINANDYTVQFGGILTLTNNQWNEITSVTGGLSTSSNTNIYFVSDINDGGITNVSPIFSIPVLNCIKNDSSESTVEIKFGTLSSTLTNESYSRERETFTGNGSNLTFGLTLTPYSRNTTTVSIDGVLQQSDSFSISNKNIIFSGSPPANSEIEVNYVTQKNLNYANIIKHVEVTSISKTTFTLPVTPSSESEVLAWVGGSYQDNSNFTLSGNILTFDTIIDSGTKVQFVIFTSVQFTDFPFIKRKSISISDGGTKTLIDVFGSQSTARYDFHLIANPLIGGVIRLQETNPINVRVESSSTDITATASTSNKLNIYINGSGNLEFQNLLGYSINLMLERHQ